jgi:phosphatidylserine/phosphatidylglycerophosphate/cardiolipin synthase-like enzyme
MRLQHNKVLIARRDGHCTGVLTGSTNFSFRGIYIQANNVLVFRSSEVAELYGRAFDAAFTNPAGFQATELASRWHLVAAQGRPRVDLCFSPHASSADLSLGPLCGAIDQASSSVLYSVAFLNLIRSGPVRAALDRLMKRPVFSYGIVDKRGGLQVRKPDGSIGVVDFSYLANNAPEPFKSEWSGGKGVNIHHKFVVTDFNLPSAKVFTGSSNFAPSGERENGDNMIMIEDRKVAQGFAIEALRIFDHLHFRANMRETPKGKGPLKLRKPQKISGDEAWFDEYYVRGSQKERDRTVFSH